MEDIQVDLDALKTRPRVHWDTLVDDQVIENDIKIHQAITKQRDKYLPDYCLLKDLWNIVLSFFFNKSTDIVVSIPIQQQDVVFDSFVHLHPLPYTKIVYGCEDGDEFKLFIDRHLRITTVMGITMSGHFPLYSNYCFMSHIRFDESDANRRFLLRIIVSDKNRWKRYRDPFWFTWDVQHSKILRSTHDVSNFCKQTKFLLVLQSNNGVVSPYCFSYQ